MGDLISRKALIKKFWEFTNDGTQRYLVPEEIWEMVELEPTAYDVDKVVEKLERLKKTNERNQNYLTAMGFRQAIEIVKGGVKHE